MRTLLQFIHHWKQKSFLQIFTIYLRYLIGGAFVIAAFGMGKFNNQELLISHPGAPIQDLQPIQQFFRVMATSGLYWNFIGWSQVIAGLLLMTQRFAKLGAVIFFGLILNIFIITVSFDFSGTPVVTGLMLLATTYLLLWDFDSLQFILLDATDANLVKSPQTGLITSGYWSAVGFLMFATIVVLALTGFQLPIQLLVCFAEGFIAFVTYFVFTRKFSRA